MALTITQADLEALLCRPLSPCEAQNFGLYLENIKTTISRRLCWNPFEPSFTGDKFFEYDPAANIYIVGPFSDMTSLSVVSCLSGEIEQDISCEWRPVDSNLTETNTCAIAIRRCRCNVCEGIGCCDDKCRRLKVTATWNSCDMDDLKLVALKMLSQDIKTSDCNENVQSKSIRSMTVTYRDTPYIDYIEKFSSVFDRWEVCADVIG